MKDRGVAPRRGPLHDARAAHLALATVAAELADDLGHRVPARHVGLRGQAARRVHGQLAVKLDPALLRPRGRLAEAAEAEALEHEPHERRERVVGVERVDVLLRHAGHAIDGELLLRRRVAELALLADAEPGRGEEELVGDGAHYLHAGDEQRRTDTVWRPLGDGDGT